MRNHFNTVHLAIDIQNSFFHDPDWTEEGFQIFQDNVLKLTHGLKEFGIPTIGIMHHGEADIFKPQFGHCEFMDFIKPHLDHHYIKEVHSALHNEQFLADLAQNNIQNIIISGIRSEQCCETTTRHAYDLGFHVDYVTEATLTFPMMHQNSQTMFSVDEIKQRCELVLADRFADIHTVESILNKFDR